MFVWNIYLGLRKFRRQESIESKIQKSVSMADVVAAAAEPDELDDIDKVCSQSKMFRVELVLISNKLF